MYYCCCVYTLQDLIFPLLDLVASTEKLKEGPELDLGKRAGNMFRMLYKKAKVCTSPRTLHKGRVLREFTFKKVNNKYCTYFSLFSLYIHLEINYRESLQKQCICCFKIHVASLTIVVSTNSIFKDITKIAMCIVACTAVSILMPCVCRYMAMWLYLEIATCRPLTMLYSSQQKVNTMSLKLSL